MKKTVFLVLLFLLSGICIFEIFYLADKYLLLYEYTKLVVDAHFEIYRNLTFHGFVGCAIIFACIILCIMQIRQLIHNPLRYTYEEYKALREAKKAEKQRKKKEKLQKQLEEIEKAE